MDYFMGLNILLILTKILKTFLAGLILINLHPELYSIPVVLLFLY